MDDTFRVKVDDSLDFEFTKQEIMKLNVIKKSESELHILHNNSSLNVEIISSDFFDKSYTVKIGSNIHHIKVSDDLDLLIEKLGLSSGIIKEINDVEAPMHGHIIDIMVDVGETVKEGDSMLILEAMKMENTLLAPKDGTVKSIRMNKGDTVEKGQLLIEME